MRETVLRPEGCSRLFWDVTEAVESYGVADMIISSFDEGVFPPIWSVSRCVLAITALGPLDFLLDGATLPCCGR